MEKKRETYIITYEMYNVLSVAPLVSNKLRPIICFLVFFVIYCKTSNLQLFFSEVNSSYDFYMYMAGINVFLHFFFFLLLQLVGPAGETLSK